jgi:hypothetical protein
MSELAYLSFVVSLLDNPSLKILHLDENKHSRTIGSLEVVMAALKFNRSLEELHICDELLIEHPNQLKLIFHGIAAAPKLRTMCLDFGKSEYTVSRMQQSEMFANA